MNEKYDKLGSLWTWTYEAHTLTLRWRGTVYTITGTSERTWTTPRHATRNHIQALTTPDVLRLTQCGPHPTRNNSNKSSGCKILWIN